MVNFDSCKVTRSNDETLEKKLIFRSCFPRAMISFPGSIGLTNAMYHFHFSDQADADRVITNT